jgi:regulator of nucleoside diphosphate kinase
MKTLVTDSDMLKLADILEGRSRWPGEDRDHVEALRRTLDSAGVVGSDDIPADIVTLHSRVRVTDLDHAGAATYTLVLGADEPTATTAVSVMSPIGTALLGRREGDEIGCWVGSGLRRFRIEDVVYQPEAATRPPAREGIQEGGT